jgi:SulP family sulfate permease
MLAGVDPNVKEQMERTGAIHHFGRENIYLATEGVGQALQEAVDAAEKWIATQPVNAAEQVVSEQLA